ncbi:glutathione S-transferase family protein [Gilvimarinus sp. SDUM040013]|uniref:Glutathione S-transferase family protein n=1 Tax=Gilvimarinus gilvus TaxID=3058038 RepID=A0ABU4S6M5_9GAMM|nr:glutathione S-transferase family protein [Gilvimarinus sp. SDUM040013]MDO3387808.1 glutathione S-transferase family protein [Gilvimarinus sp. SDUM040013]MDX6851049.1 glutathione S-transferase family protein [Gilvimarinus sp. SDUM040013]
MPQQFVEDYTMLYQGKWQQNWNPYQKTGDNGDFVRQTSQFRSQVTHDGRDYGFKAEPGRYHLYLAKICPWASRTLMARALLGLEDVISVSFVEPFLTDKGWRFGNYPGAGPDPLHNFQHVHELYTHADAQVTGRATVPILWDKQRDTLVNNESADILKMLNSVFAPLGTRPINLRPEPQLNELDALNDDLYHRLNNGVYRAGFAKSQTAYDAAVDDVFSALDDMEVRLNQRRFLLGENLTEADIRLFVTLVRFDAAYHGLFKCNRRTLASYANLSHYLERIYQLPGIAETVDLDHIKAGYYSVKALNPTGIIPTGPELNWRAAS